MIVSGIETQGHGSYLSIFHPFLFLSLYNMLTFKICVVVSGGTFKARMLKLDIRMDNKLLYCGIEKSNFLLLLLPLFVHFSVFYGLICVTVFSGTVQARIFKYGICM